MNREWALKAACAGMDTDLTARTPLGAVDLVPLMRRLAGDHSADIPTHERRAAVLALSDLGYRPEQIMRASGLGMSAVQEVLDGQRDARAAELRQANTEAGKRASWRAAHARRLAGRVEVNGRLIHPRASHGTNGAYQAYGCRCGPCCRAHADVNAAARRRTA